jgi:hypothetical protein
MTLCIPVYYISVCVYLRLCGDSLNDIVHICISVYVCTCAYAGIV